MEMEFDLYKLKNQKISIKCISFHKDAKVRKGFFTLESGSNPALVLGSWKVEMQMRCSPAAAAPAKVRFGT